MAGVQLICLMVVVMVGSITAKPQKPAVPSILPHPGAGNVLNEKEADAMIKTFFSADPELLKRVCADLGKPNGKKVWLERALELAKKFGPVQDMTEEQVLESVTSFVNGVADYFKRNPEVCKKH